MEQIGIRALKQNASQVVARAAAGETLTITDRGRPVARITPLTTARLDALIDAGDARRPRRRLAELGVPTEAARLSDEIDSMRADERY